MPAIVCDGMLWMLLVGCRSLGEPPAPEPVVVAPATRYVPSAAGIVLEVATDRYARPEGLGEVVVVGSVHVADPAFYEVSVATLGETEQVFYEGLIDDVGADPDQAESLAASLGLAAQADVAVDRPGWRHVDLRQSELRRRMAADGVPPEGIDALLGDPSAPDPPPTPVPDGPAGPALAKLALIKALAAPPDDDPAYQRWLIAERDTHIIDQLPAPGPSVGLWYGADHLPDLGRRLQAAGYDAPERRWVPAMVVTYRDLRLGPAQVQMLLDGGPD